MTSENLEVLQSVGWLYSWWVYYWKYNAYINKTNWFAFRLCGWQWNSLLCRSPNGHHKDKVVTITKVARKFDISRRRSCTFLLCFFSQRCRKYQCCNELCTLMNWELITLSLLSLERKNKNESILKREIINVMENGVECPLACNLYL